MSTPHTKGPWHVVQPYRAGSGSIVCEVLPPGGMPTQIRASTDVDISEAERQANIRLIAAAPDLLAELKRMSRAYVTLLEKGRERILSFGGTCDPVHVMQAGDPALRSCAGIIAKVDVGTSPTGLEVGKTYPPRKGSRSAPRTITWISRSGDRVQYDSDAVAMGRHFPTISAEAFAKWAGLEISQ